MIVQDYVDGLNLGKAYVNDDHRHTGLDKPKVALDNLSPTIIGTLPIQSGDSLLPDGTIQFYNVQDSPLKDWGLNISMNGIWNPFTIVPSVAGANQATPKTFASGTPAMLICDNVIYDLYPTGEYSDTTGDFSPETAGQYFITAGVTLDNSAGNSGLASIIIYKEHNATPIQFFRKTVYVDAAETTVTLDVNGILQAEANDTLYVIVDQNLGGPVTTLLDENTWINFHKLK